jgi:hypothetical protein
MKQSIVLYHHLGLGDHFICNGLVNYFSEHHHVHLPCKIQYLTTIKSLYQENHNVTVFPIFREPDDVRIYTDTFKLPLTTVGFQNLGDYGTVWYRSFYRQHNIPYDYRYEKFTIPRALPNANTLFYSLRLNEPYIVIHDTSGSNSTGYTMNIDVSINRVVKIDPTCSHNLLDWITIIRNASEIHVVPSSVFCLVDSIASSLNARLYYHDIRIGTGILHSDIERPGTNWKVIKYDRQL